MPLLTSDSMRPVDFFSPSLQWRLEHQREGARREGHACSAGSERERERWLRGFSVMPSAFYHPPGPEARAQTLSKQLAGV